jgi:DNA repair protein RadC
VPIGWKEISRGTLNASLVHPREVFLPAIMLAACSLILIHNHPSSDTTPSREDIELTRRMVQAADILGIEILDHLIVTDTTHLSFKESKLF